MSSHPATVEEYLAGLPEDRRAAISAVRAVIRANLPDGYVETVQYGAIGYVVPHTLFPPGYHCDPSQPLTLAVLASQKNYVSLHLMTIYGDPATAEWFRDAYAASGKKLDMGKACIRFKKLEDLPLEVIGQAIARVPAQAYIERYEAALRARGKDRKRAASSG
jgi:uncharacterized protein YdhG (YjbR/CyaY superfamily)